MDELKMKAKKKVLEEIMSMMDEKMSDGMKAKSPKFQAIEIKAEEEPMEMDEDEVSDEEKQRVKELYEKYFT